MRICCFIPCIRLLLVIERTFGGGGTCVLSLGYMACLDSSYTFVDRSTKGQVWAELLELANLLSINVQFRQIPFCKAFVCLIMEFLHKCSHS